MDNITNRIRHSPLLICCPTSLRGNGSVFCTGLCKGVHKSNLYSLRVLHRNLHPCETVTGCSSTVSSRVQQFHTKVYTESTAGQVSVLEQKWAYTHWQSLLQVSATHLDVDSEWLSLLQLPQNWAGSGGRHLHRLQAALEHHLEHAGGTLTVLRCLPFYFLFSP